jgi:hypothetical protein
VLLIGPFPLGHGAEKCVRAIGDAKTGRTLSARTLRPSSEPTRGCPPGCAETSCWASRPPTFRQRPSHDRETSVKGPTSVRAPSWLVLREDRVPPAPAPIEIVRPAGGRLRSPAMRLGSLPARPGRSNLCAAAASQGRGARRRARASQSGPPLWWPAVGPGMAPTVRLSAAISAASGPTPPQLATPRKPVQLLSATG